MPQFKLNFACFVKRDVIMKGWNGGSDGKEVRQERSALRNDTDGVVEMA